MRALCSFSGGLDSMLAARIVIDQGVDVKALYFRTGFGGCGDSEDVTRVRNSARSLGMDFVVVDVGEDIIKIIQHPKFGFGKNLNPCIDCHSLFFRKCGEYMEQMGAFFVITGEVLGERPMSQRKAALSQIDRETGLSGLIVRPLSARLLDITVPEKKRWIDREKLMAISGRSRKPQIELARKFGITSYPNAAGGCLLTQDDFSRRLKDLMDHEKDISPDDIRKLRYGRHFRLSGGSKFVAGRNEKENTMLINSAAEGDLCYMTVDIPGPVGVLSGRPDAEDQKAALKIISAYSDIPGGKEITIVRKIWGDTVGKELRVVACSKKHVKRFLI